MRNMTKIYGTVTVLEEVSEFSVAFSKTGLIRIRFASGRKVKLVSTHNAEDCFMGTFCKAFNKGVSLNESIKTADHVAAIHVSRPKSY
jgi:ribokinase